MGRRTRLGRNDHRHPGDRGGLDEVMKSIAEPSVRQPEKQCIHSPPPKHPAMLDVVADGRQRAPQASLDGGLRQPGFLRDGAIRVTAEVGQLDYVLVLCGKSADRVVDSVPDHRAREILPCMWPVLAVAHAFDQHLLQALVGSPHAAAVDRGPAGASHQPRPPGVVRGRRKRTVLGFRHLPVLRCTGNSGRLQITRAGSSRRRSPRALDLEDSRLRSRD